MATERAVRAARLAPLASHEKLASATGVTVRGLRNALVALPARGLCGEVVRRMSLPGYKPAVRVTAVRSAWCPPGVVRALTTSSADDLRDAASDTANAAAWTIRGQQPGGARCDAAPSTLRRLAYDSYARWRSSWALVCSTCPPAVLVGVAEDLTETWAGVVPFAHIPEADEPAWPAAAVAVFAASTYHRARLVAAELPSCPSVALAAFACDSERDMRVAAISHPACPPEPLAAAAACRDFELNAAACKHPNLAPDAQPHLAASADPRTRAMLATNTSCDAHTLIRLAHDESETVRAAAATNPALDVATLQQLAQDPAAKSAPAR